MTQTTMPVSEGEHILFLYRRLSETMLAALRTLSDEELNWRPPMPGSNSRYVIAYHAATASEWWLHIALGTIDERDRTLEFSARGTFTTLEEHFNAWLRAAEQAIPSLQDYEAVHVLPSGQWTTRYALWHIIEHLSLHLGHIEITGQWYEQEQRAESIH